MTESRATHEQALRESLECIQTPDFFGRTLIERILTIASEKRAAGDRGRLEIDAKIYMSSDGLDETPMAQPSGHHKVCIYVHGEQICVVPIWPPLT